MSEGKRLLILFVLFALLAFISYIGNPENFEAKTVQEQESSFYILPDTPTDIIHEVGKILKRDNPNPAEIKKLSDKLAEILTYGYVSENELKSFLNAFGNLLKKSGSHNEEVVNFMKVTMQTITGDKNAPENMKILANKVVSMTDSLEKDTKDTNNSIDMSFLAPFSSEEILKMFLPDAKENNVTSQIFLGNLYYTGYKLPQNTEKAIYWYTRAAEQGNYSAQFFLGNILFKANNIPENKQKSLYWLQNAADHGFAPAQSMLGIILLNESPPFNDKVKGLKYLTAAADQEEKESEYVLGNAYFHGQLGITADQQKGFHYLLKAAEHDKVSAQLVIGDIYSSGKYDIAKDLKKAAEWYQKAADQGNPAAQRSIGIYYFEGSGGLPENNELAYKWFKLAADQQDGIALTLLAKMYIKGLYVDTDYTKARELLNDPAAENTYWRDYLMGKLYENGWGVEKDLTKARAYYHKAQDIGCKQATESLQELEQNSSAAAGSSNT